MAPLRPGEWLVRVDDPDAPGPYRATVEAESPAEAAARDAAQAIKENPFDYYGPMTLGHLEQIDPEENSGLIAAVAAWADVWDADGRQRLFEIADLHYALDRLGMLP